MQPYVVLEQVQRQLLFRYENAHLYLTGLDIGTGAAYHIQAPLQTVKGQGVVVIDTIGIHGVLVLCPQLVGLLVGESQRPHKQPDVCHQNADPSPLYATQLQLPQPPIGVVVTGNLVVVVVVVVVVEPQIQTLRPSKH